MIDVNVCPNCTEFEVTPKVIKCINKKGFTKYKCPRCGIEFEYKVTKNLIIQIGKKILMYKNSRSDSENETISPIELPLEEVMKIQKELKPLGYIVCGYKQEECPRKIILYLERDYPFVKI